MRSRCLLVVVGSLMLVGTVLAQVPTLPPGTQPGRIERDIQPSPQPAPRDASIAIPRDAFPEQAPEGAEQVTFVLKALELNGNTALTTDALAPIWNDRIGQPVKLSEVFQIAARITARYREAGYILSQAIVPKQDIRLDQGRVRIEVLEGYIANYSFTGPVANRALLDRHMAPIVSERPLRLATLERYLLLLNELSGLSARANIRPSDRRNASDLEIVLSEQRRAFSITVHNRTAKAIGPLRIDASADFRGWLGHYDRHVFRWVGSGNGRLNLLGYSGEVPIGGDGLRANWGGSVSRAKPKSGLPFNLDTDSENLSLGLSYPIIRSRETNLQVRGNLSAYNGETNFTGLQLSKDRIRALRVGATWDRVDTFGGIHLVDLEVSRGLSALGASREGDPLLSRIDADPQFTKAALYLARLQSLRGPWSLLLAASAQFSNDALVSSEQFGLGGDLFLRAYDPSEILGDSGAAGKIELRYNRALSSVPTTIYVYHDMGRVSLNTPNGKIRSSALSTGAGIRFALPFTGSRQVRGFIEISKPNHRVVASRGDEDTRGFAGIGFDF